MNSIDNELDRKACEMLAPRLKLLDWSIFKNKSIEEIASEIPQYRLLSHAEGREGMVSRNFGSLSAMVYDLKTHKKDYKADLAKARAFHLTRGLPVSKNFSYMILDHGIKEDIGYIILGHKNKNKF